MQNGGSGGRAAVFHHECIIPKKMKLSKLLFENNEPELDDYSSFEEWAEYEAPSLPLRF